MVNRWLGLLVLGLLLLGFVVGCGEPTGKGVNSGKDKPIPAEKGG